MEDGSNTLPTDDAFFKMLFEQTPCYCCILDQDLKIIAANRMMRENFATVFSRRCFQVFKGRDTPCEECPAKLSLRDNSVKDTVETIQHRSGRNLKVICRTAPLNNMNHVMHMSVRMGKDRELQQAMTALDSQVGAVSHGIKGLLTAMAGGFYLWDSGFEKNRGDRVKQGVSIVRRNYKRLQRMAHDVLYYIRDRKMRMTVLDAKHVLRETYLEMKEDGAYAGAALEIANEPIDPLPMEGDLRAVSSALANLIASSLHDCYLDKRKIDHKVLVSLKKEDSFAVFEVQDNAMGVKPEVRSKIFSLFFNPKGIEAAGVGLYITNKLVRAHKGEVSFDSQERQGTRYVMRLPIKQN